MFLSPRDLIDPTLDLVHRFRSLTRTFSPHLDPRASTLFHDHRIKTAAKLTGAFERFHAFIPSDIDWNTTPFSVKHTLILNYVTHLRNLPNASRGSITDGIRSISFFHRSLLNNEPDPTSSPSLRDFLAAVENSFPDTDVRRRFPFTRAEIARLTLLSHDWSVSGRPHFHRMFILIPLSYKAASRIGEILQLQRKDVVFSDTHFVLNFPSRKNKKRRTPSLCFIDNDPDSCFDLRAAFTGYLSHLNILRPASGSPQDFVLWEEAYIFPGGFIDTTTGRPTGPITYHAVYDQLKLLCNHLGLDASLFGWHSTRTSGVSDLFSAGFAPSDIAAHSGHRSLKSLDSYNQGTLKSRLKTSASLSF